MLFVLAACGSTVQDRSQLAQRQGNVPVDEFGNPIPGATTGPGGTFVPGQPGSTIGGGGGGFIPGTNTPVSGNNGPGITSTSIRIGDVYCDDQEAAARALGFEPEPTDSKRAWEIVLEDTNKRGGINGRKVEMEWYRFKDCSAVTQSPTQLYEGACQHFTRDRKVFAVMGAQENVPNYIACVLRAGAVMIHFNVTDYDKQFLRQYPYFIEPGNLAVDTAARLQIPSLKAQGYFKKVDASFPTVKIGLVVEDTPGFERVLNGALLPALRQAGYSVSSDNIQRIQPLQSLNDVGALTAEISAAVLRFNANRVSHVLFLQARGNLTLFFLREAESQDYYPRYGFTSQDGPQSVLDYSGGGVVSARNYHNSLGIGWNPLGDVPRESWSAGPPERIACLDLLKKNGYTALGDANAEAIALSVCDSMSFLKLSVSRTGSIINQSTFLAAVNRIGGNRWRSASGLGGYSLLLPTKHDGNNHYRTFAFDRAKGYFEYTSSNIPIGY
jgi:hypothetical protein